jgi:hypothetical protein
VFIQDTIVVSRADGRIDTAITDGHWCVFVLKTEYDAQVLGLTNAPAAQEIQRDLQVIKAVLRAKARAGE